MALRFMDSFDHYTANPYLWHKWTGSRNIGVTAFTTGRFGDQAWNSSERYSFLELDDQPTWIWGGACQFSGSSLPNAFAGFWDASANQVDVRFDNNLKVIWVTRNGTQLGSQVPFAPFRDDWYYIEFKATIHSSTGIAVVRINGTTVINLSGQNTDAQGTGHASRLRIGSHADQQTSCNIDDMYLCDGTGAGPDNDFLGDCACVYRAPNGNGNSSQLVGQDADSTDNYLNVDELRPPDSDTTYNESSTPGDKDTYTYEDLAQTAGTVYGVQPLLYARKTDAGSRSIVSVARLSATEVDGPVRDLGASYIYHRDIRTTKPGGGSWTVTDFNNAEFGVKVNA